jgi:hypothetical protein
LVPTGRSKVSVDLEHEAPFLGYSGQEVLRRQLAAAVIVCGNEKERPEGRSFFSYSARSWIVVVA